MGYCYKVKIVIFLKKQDKILQKSGTDGIQG